MIEVKDITFSYGKNRVFDRFNLSIEKGEFVAILGHNGSGKSTLSRLLVSLEVPAAGAIFIDGEKLGANTIAKVRKKISMVFQNPDNQFVGSTVLDEVAFGLENRNVSREGMRQIVGEKLSDFGLLGLEEKAPHQLSGGQKQRVALASAMAVNPEVLILDEATSMLDPVGRHEVMTLVRELGSEKQRTVIMVTHHLEEAAHADRIVVLVEGAVIGDGTPKEILADVELLKKASLDVPFAVIASKKLIKAGMLNEICVNDEELVNGLCALNLTT